MNKYPREQIPGEQTSGEPASLTTIPDNTISKLVETQKSIRLKAHSNKGILLEFIQLKSKRLKARSKQKEYYWNFIQLERGMFENSL